MPIGQDFEPEQNFEKGMPMRRQNFLEMITRWFLDTFEPSDQGVDVSMFILPEIEQVFSEIDRAILFMAANKIEEEHAGKWKRV